MAYASQTSLPAGFRTEPFMPGRAGAVAGRGKRVKGVPTTPNRECTTKLGARLRDRRLNKGWTQRRMAAEIGTRQNLVSRWESGAHLPTLIVLHRYAQAFGITVSALLDGVL